MQKQKKDGYHTHGIFKCKTPNLPREELERYVDQLNAVPSILAKGVKGAFIIDRDGEISYVLVDERKTRVEKGVEKRRLASLQNCEKENVEHTDPSLKIGVYRGGPL